MKTSGKIVVLVVLVFIIFPIFVNAAPNWWPLVPCGTSVNPEPCNRCDLFKLLKNIIDFVLMGLMPPVAAILFVWGGFLILMGGANPGWITQGKSIFWNTAMGVAIILASWLITNSIIRSIAVDNVAKEWWKFSCSVTTGGGDETLPSTPIGGGVGTLPDGGTGLQRYGCSQNNTCVTDNSGPYIESSCDNACEVLAGNPLPGIGNLPGGGTGSISRYSCNSNNQCISNPSGPYIESTCDNACSVLPSTPIGGGVGTLPDGGTGLQRYGCSQNNTCVTDSNGLYTSSDCDNQCQVPVGGAICPQSTWNLCQARPMTCSNSRCGQYVSAINQYAGGAASANLLKAVMIKESSCNILADSGHAYGLMQLVPSTANIYKSRCRVTDNITSTWLKTSANASASICIAAEYLRALSSTSCGSTPRNIAAGYNGGSGACGRSADCSGNSCDGSPIKRWECLYDDTAHNTCNTGYDETRDYATKVLYCYNNPGF